MSIYQILKRHGIRNQHLVADLQGLLTAKEMEGFENGVKQGRAERAEKGSEPKDEFIEKFDKQEQALKAIRQIIEESGI